MFYNDNSVGFCFEVLPQTGADEEMTSRSSNPSFTPIPPGYGVQWTMFGDPIVDDQFQNLHRHASRNRRGQRAHRPEFFIELADARVPARSEATR